MSLSWVALGDCTGLTILMYTQTHICRYGIRNGRKVMWIENKEGVCDLAIYSEDAVKILTKISCQTCLIQNILESVCCPYLQRYIQ